MKLFLLIYIGLLFFVSCMAILGGSADDLGRKAEGLAKITKTIYYGTDTERHKADTVQLTRAQLLQGENQ